MCPCSQLCVSPQQHNNFSRNAMVSIKTELENIFRNAQSAFQGFSDKTGGLGSIQFLVTGEAAAIACVGLEAGISIDVRQILHFLSHDFQWDPSVTQLLSFHVGYAVDIGAQAGGDVGFCVGYHTSRVTGVKYLFALAHVHNSMLSNPFVSFYTSGKWIWMGLQSRRSFRLCRWSCEFTSDSLLLTTLT